MSTESAIDTTSASVSFLAEFVATAAIVFASCALAAADRQSEGRIGLVGRALGLGMVSTAVLAGAARRSFGLANPAVVLALLSIGRASFGATVKLLIAQSIGGIFGAVC